MLLVFIVCHVLLSTLLLLSWIEMCLLCSSNSTRDNSIHGHHQIANTEIRLIIFFAAKNGKALYSQQKQPGADCGSDHELLIAKFRLKRKNVGKSTRPFRYDLNQIPYDNQWK